MTQISIYWSVNNRNTQRQGNEIGLIIKKVNYTGWKLHSKSTAIIDKKNNLKSVLILEKVKDLKEASHHDGS